ncbi:MAG: hypothetical protein KC549_08805, partial [Myxococcales bacterium]|nr:hypothetical protein [Myxococcales bacterium]
REARDKTPGTLTAVAGRFEVLTIDRRDLTDDDDVEGVRRAVDAWLAFGGLGGRTRRGFGAVAADTVRDPAEELARLSAGLQNRAGVTSLAGARLVTHPKSDATALSALDRGLGRLKAFRQGPGIGRNPGTDDPRRPGRSRWPEADEIRRITGQADRKHRTPLTTTRAFPRAAFGLPIIFHFKDFGDPSDTTLKPRGTERMASPLIIRPYARDEGFGSFALRLSAPMPTPIELGNSAADNVPTAITDAEARSDLMRTALDGNSDVLGAFLKFFAGD